MKIGLDFDGVISNIEKLKIKNLKTIFDLDVLPHELRKEILLNKYLTEDQYSGFQRMIYETHEYGSDLEAVDHALEFICQILQDGHELVVITSRLAGLDIARRWFAGFHIDIPFVGVGVGKSKANAARGCQIYVDDDYNKLRQLIDVVPRLFLFSWGYNAHIVLDDGIKRTKSWEEFYYEHIRC